MSAAATLLTGTRLGRYRLIQEIGKGGMGAVYRAEDEHLQRQVAIKVLAAGTLADDAARRRFRNEAMALSRISHGNIAAVYDFDTQDGLDFLVTELVSGAPVSELIAGAPLPIAEALKIGEQLAEGLAAAHACRVLHRDIKPSNLRLTADGRLKILDFGLAQPLPIFPDEDTASSADLVAIAGTLHYMSPEQLRGGPLEDSTDIYAAGVVLYEMLTGRRPFEHATVPGLTNAIFHETPAAPGRLRPGISTRIDQIVLRCLSKYPAQRYSAADELAADLRRASAADEHPSNAVAVLYFENLGGDQENEYFRDGITEDITTELSRIAGLRVFSRSAVLVYRDRPVTPAEVGRQLQATHLLEGSIRRDGLRLRVTAKLVETSGGQCHWAERYDRRIEDVFAIQDEIAQSIARALRILLTERERRVIERIPTASIEAYDLYLRGRHFFHQFRHKGLTYAKEMFTRAIQLDPHYAHAYAGIADCCSWLYMYWDSSEDNLQQADAASLRALELDPDSAEAHASRGLVASHRKDYDEAKRELETAMRLQPRLFEPYYFYARNCYAQGRLDEAVEWFGKASQVNPEDYQSRMLMASALHGLGRQESAREAYQLGLAAAQKHLLLHPEDARALYFGANALSQVGDKERSLEWVARAQALEPDEPQVLYNVACVFALLGENARAIDCLERSMTHGWGQKQWMANDPDLAPLRSDPRFQRLVAG
jgi:TolB-like protein/Flp pilus assembly protein TadD/tRNA A-37 threonylcarbamoyl transferase component Bud32